MLCNAAHSTQLSFRDWEQGLIFFHVNVSNCYISLLQPSFSRIYWRYLCSGFLCNDIPDLAAYPRLYRVQRVIELSSLLQIVVDFIVSTGASERTPHNLWRSTQLLTQAALYSSSHYLNYVYWIAPVWRSVAQIAVFLTKSSCTGQKSALLSFH